MEPSVLFITPYPQDESPSQRFRFEQYYNILHENHVHFQTHSFWTLQDWEILYTDGNRFRKLIALLSGSLKRLLLLFKVPRFHFIFIHREAMPVGLPIWEWIVAKILRKKVIYDFDDAIWTTDNKQESGFEKALRYRKKVGIICRWSYKVSCGNKYLQAFASQFNKNIIYNPSTIDTENLHNPIAYPINKGKERLIIGWTGSHSTAKYLGEVEKVLIQLEKEFGDRIMFVFISDKAPELRLKNCEFVPWKKSTEIEDLMHFDIGIMPLPDDDWSKGKCGFKLLQYMALKIPAVASAVGANITILRNGEIGYLCGNPEEWKNALSQLINNETQRRRLGDAGREEVCKNYSVRSNTSNFLSLFR